MINLGTEVKVSVLGKPARYVEGSVSGMELSCNDTALLTIELDLDKLNNFIHD